MGREAHAGRLLVDAQLFKAAALQQNPGVRATGICASHLHFPPARMDFPGSRLFMVNPGP